MQPSGTLLAHVLIYYNSYNNKFIEEMESNCHYFYKMRKDSVRICTTTNPLPESISYYLLIKYIYL